MNPTVNSNVIHRTFHIKYNDSMGTAFTIDVGVKRYLVTAAHVLHGLGQNHNGTDILIDILKEDNWSPIAAKIIEIGNENEHDKDLAVLSPCTALSPTYELPLPATAEGLAFGQDVYILGFPWFSNLPCGLHSNIKDLNFGYPLPFVRKAILSRFASEDLDEFHLDGINNKGFSGGPAVFFDQSGVIKVLGIVSGRFKDPNCPDRETGIISCVPIKNALSIINRNPIGFALNR